jgi:hypothetical protein
VGKSGSTRPARRSSSSGGHGSRATRRKPPVPLASETAGWAQDAVGSDVRDHPRSIRCRLVPWHFMTKQKKPRIYPDPSASEESSGIDSIGIGQAAKELSAALREFDRQAASWMRVGEKTST